MLYWTQLKLHCSDERISWNGHERIYKYIWMPHYVPNKYPNICGCHIFTKRISEYICTPELAQIQIRIIVVGNSIRIFEYSYSSLIEEIFEKVHQTVLHWNCTKFTLYCTKQCCTGRFFTELFCTDRFCTEHFCTEHFCTERFCTERFCTEWFCAEHICTERFCFALNLYCTEVELHWICTALKV